MAKKSSENNGHRKLMVHGEGLSLKDTRREEKENFGPSGTQDRGQQLSFLFSPNGKNLLRNKRKTLLPLHDVRTCDFLASRKITLRIFLGHNTWYDTQLGREFLDLYLVFPLVYQNFRGWAGYLSLA
jgi:hypothetical protein